MSVTGYAPSDYSFINLTLEFDICCLMKESLKRSDLQPSYQNQTQCLALQVSQFHLRHRHSLESTITTIVRQHRLVQMKMTVQ